MNDRSAFDHRPDPEIGDALRAMLASDDDSAFVARVLAAARWGLDQTPWWEVLTVWARPGLVAAGVLAGAALSWSLLGAREAGGTGLLGDPLRAAGERAAVPSYIVADTPDVEAMMALVQENP